MATTKPPHRGSKRPSHHHGPPGRREPTRPPSRPAGDGRLHECEEAVLRLHADVDLLRAEVETLRSELALAMARIRRVPPPLPAHHHEEVISVDEREVVLETIRPRRPKR